MQPNCAMVVLLPGQMIRICSSRHLAVELDMLGNESPPPFPLVRALSICEKWMMSCIGGGVVVLVLTQKTSGGARCTFPSRTCYERLVAAIFLWIRSLSVCGLRPGRWWLRGAPPEIIWLCNFYTAHVIMQHQKVLLLGQYHIRNTS